MRQPPSGHYALVDHGSSSPGRYRFVPATAIRTVLVPLAIVIVAAACSDGPAKSADAIRHAATTTVNRHDDDVCKQLQILVADVNIASNEGPTIVNNPTPHVVQPTPEEQAQYDADKAHVRADAADLDRLAVDAADPVLREASRRIAAVQRGGVITNPDDGQTVEGRCSAIGRDLGPGYGLLG